MNCLCNLHTSGSIAYRRQSQCIVTKTTAIVQVVSNLRIDSMGQMPIPQASQALLTSHLLYRRKISRLYSICCKDVKFRVSTPQTPLPLLPSSPRSPLYLRPSSLHKSHHHSLEHRSNQNKAPGKPVPRQPPRQRYESVGG